MANLDDTGYDVPDPEALQNQNDAVYQRDYNRAPNQYEANRINLGQSVNNILGAPNVNRAQGVADRFKAILANANSEAVDGESPLDTQQRIAKALSIGMADSNPKIAMQANHQMLLLDQQKKQQSLLSAQVDNENQRTEDAKQKSEIDKVGQVFQVHSLSKGQDGLPEYKVFGDPVSMYKDDGSIDPDFHAKLNAAMVAAKKSGAENPVFSTVGAFENSKSNVALARGQMQFQLAQQKAALKAQQTAAGLDPETIRFTAGLAAADANALTRQPAEVRNAVTKYWAAAGLQPDDIQSARLEAVAIKSEARAASTRTGNIALLQDSLDGLGKQVITRLENVDRTRFTVINGLIANGKGQMGDPNEKRYAGAIQSFVTEYARLLSGGGGGVTSDSARADAMKLLSTADSPAAVRAGY